MKTEIREIEQGKVFGLTIPKEYSGMFRAGWNPEELEKLKIFLVRCNAVESGNLAVASLDGAEPRIFRVHLQNRHVLLETPKNLDFPNSVVEPVVLTEEEAEIRLEILAKVTEVGFVLADGGNGND